MEDGDGPVRFITARRIQAGEELFLDYGEDYDRSGYATAPATAPQNAEGDDGTAASMCAPRQCEITTAELQRVYKRTPSAKLVRICVQESIWYPTGYFAVIPPFQVFQVLLCEHVDVWPLFSDSS